MRDVDGSIAFFDRHVTRTIAPGSSAKPFLESSAGKKTDECAVLASEWNSLRAPDAAASADGRCRTGFGE